MSLNRFGINESKHLNKINSKCEFTSKLDLSNLIHNVNDDVHKKIIGEYIYDLHGMLIHSGGLEGGHYYCFLKPDVVSDKWFKFNDNIVTEID